ncbi:MAG: response regulator, partial [Planctomycetota bacterium]
MDILFIEDEVNASEGLRAVMKAHEHETDIATTADKAVEFMEKKKYDVVLLDIMLPPGKKLPNVPFRETGKELLMRL